MGGPREKARRASSRWLSLTFRSNVPQNAILPLPWDSHRE
jgi:hypothetical protein